MLASAGYGDFNSFASYTAICTYLHLSKSLSLLQHLASVCQNHKKLSPLQLLIDTDDKNDITKTASFFSKKYSWNKKYSSQYFCVANKYQLSCCEIIWNIALQQLSNVKVWGNVRSILPLFYQISKQIVNSVLFSLIEMACLKETSWDFGW